MTWFWEFIHYWDTLGFQQVFRVCWFYFIFEFTRYILLEFFVLIIWKVRRFLNRDKWEEARREFWDEAPLVSILVPGKNEGKHIYKLVTSLQAQTYKNFELIIVDDGSDDDTEIICNTLKKNGLIDKFFRNDVRGGKASGANTALRYAKGKYVVHLDADCSYHSDAIEKILIPFYYNKNVGGVGGNVLVRNYKEALVCTLSAIEYQNVISTGRVVTSELGIYKIISGAFGAFRKDILDRLGGWDIGPGLDGDITVKIRKLGYDTVFEHYAVCETSSPNTFKKLAKQRWRWDKSLIRFRLRKHMDVYLPNKSFSFRNFFSFVENLTYNVVLDFKWFIYLFDIIFNYADRIMFILPINLVLYTCSNYIKAIVFAAFRPRKNAPMWYFLPYVPLMVIYLGYYLRAVRSKAYFDEIFFRKSYDDPWNPEKSSSHAKRIGL